MTSFLKTVPVDLFQLEIGVQSTNLHTLDLVDRKTNIEKVKSNISILQSNGNIHLHTDLIAGLPFEDMESFKKSFNDVLNIRPDVLQMGFLKLLKGSKIRGQEQTYGYKYLDTPPYEVLSNKFLSYDDLLQLKQVENVLEKYYNSGVFEKSLSYILNLFDTPFDFFDQLAKYFTFCACAKLSISQQKLYDILYDFYKLNFSDEMFYSCLKFDFLKNNRGAKSNRLVFEYDKLFLKWRVDFICSARLAKYLPQYSGEKGKDILKYVHFEKFDYDVINMQNISCIIAFDYKNKQQILIEETIDARLYYNT